MTHAPFHSAKRLSRKSVFRQMGQSTGSPHPAKTLINGHFGKRKGFGNRSGPAGVPISGQPLRCYIFYQVGQGGTGRGIRVWGQGAGRE
jgi:hypothetical protein